MRKSIAVVGLFALLAAVALVYAVQFSGTSLGVSGGSTSNPTGSPFTIDPNSVPQVQSAENSNIEFEWKVGNPYLLRNSNGNVFVDLRISGKAQPNPDRKRVNLVLVIDRSGS